MARSRRANNEGSIYYDEKIQRFVGQFRYTDLQTGERKRKKITNKRKIEVIKKGKAFLKDIELMRAGKKSTENLLGDYMREWLENTVKPTVRQKTYERYDSLLRCYVLPTIGNIALTDLTRIILQKFLYNLQETGSSTGGKLSASTVNATRRLIKTALDVAVADGLMRMNVTDLTKALHVTKRPIAIFTVDEYKKLLETARIYNSRAYLVIRIAFATGFRIGEIFGLEYSAIDFSQNLISVKQTVISTRHGKRLQLMAKNSTSLRTIKVEQALIDELKLFKEEHQRRKRLYRNKYEQKHDFIIENEDGTFCDPAYFTDRIFKQKLLKQAGLSQDYRMHDCRHTHASWLISKGVNIKAVSERLGHKSIRTTLDIYSHITRSMQDEAVNALEEILSEK